MMQQLGANVPLALLLTVSSNILGIFTMPFLIAGILAAAPEAAAAAAAAETTASLEPVPLLLQLWQDYSVAHIARSTATWFCAR